MIVVVVAGTFSACLLVARMHSYNFLRQLHVKECDEIKGKI
jgi:hypothetical protein